MVCVFVSHASSDRRVVERKIISLLRRNGINVWYAPTDIKNAEEWERQILRGLETCGDVLVVMSPNAAASEWVRREVNWAIAERRRIIPVMLKECRPDQLHLGLHSLQYLDFRRNIKQAQAKLLSLLRAEAEPEKPPPPGRGPRLVWAFIISLLLLAVTLSGYWYLSTPLQPRPAPPESNGAEATTSPTPQESRPDTRSSANANRQTNERTAPTVTVTPLDRRLKPSDAQGANK